MAQTSGRNLPPPQSAFVDPAPALSLSYDGYQYLLSLLNFAAGQIPTATLSPSLVAKGATQATATTITDQWNEFDTVPAGSGALLSALQPGQSQDVFNEGANSLKVYPPPGAQIDALAINAPYTLTAGKMQTFRTMSATQIRTTQLQVP